MDTLTHHTKREDLTPKTIEKLMKERIGYIEVEAVDTLDEVIDNVLAGPIALIIDGEQQIILIDAREYPARNPDEPDLERVTRGARDGFVETIVFNTALVRRRIRDPNLRNVILKVGTRSKTDVVVSYIKGLAKQELIDEIKTKIKSIKTDALPMGEKSLEEFIIGKTLNPLPKVKFTERPDVVSAHLLEGYVAIFVDTTPSIMIVPASLFNFTQHAEDYYQNPVVGTYIRWIRFIAIFISFILPPLWLLLVLEKAFLPEWLGFLGPREVGKLSLFVQFIILEIGIDLIRIALIHTPNSLATSLGLLGAILLGDFAVKVGLFSPETILYIAITAIASFAIPSIEFSFAIRLFRLFILISTGFYRLPGFITSLLLVFLLVAFTKSFGGLPYLWPLIPFNYKAFSTVIFRKPIPEVKNTGGITKGQNSR
jgi:stage V sporulation protein AF